MCQMVESQALHIYILTILTGRLVACPCLLRAKSFTMCCVLMLPNTGIEGCSRLHYLDVHRNRLSDVAEIKNCNLLKQLNLGNNCLTAFPCIPLALLTSLSLKANRYVY